MLPPEKTVRRERHRCHMSVFPTWSQNHVTWRVTLVQYSFVSSLSFICYRFAFLLEQKCGPPRQANSMVLRNDTTRYHVVLHVTRVTINCVTLVAKDYSLKAETCWWRNNAFLRRYVHYYCILCLLRSKMILFCYLWIMNFNLVHV